MVYRGIAGLGGGSEEIYRYTTSLDHDVEILPYALRVLEAHVRHLAEKRVIPVSAAEATLRALEELKNVEPPREGYEDVWEWIEEELDRRTRGLSRWIWIGRSRNDHVSAALRMLAADRLRQLIEAIDEFLAAAGSLKAREGSVLIPLHTHRQPSQVGTLSCLIDSWIEGAVTVRRLAESVLPLVERSPLGASAGAGTLAPLDPWRLASLAGLGEPLVSSVYAAGSRLDVSAAASVAALALTEASRAAGDLILYSNPYVGILRLPDSHVATSSIMPHKRNPATMEVLVARAKRGQACLASILSIQAGLPSGYSLDLQEANPCLYLVLSDAVEAYKVLASAVEGVRVNRERALELLRLYTPWSAEEAERRALVEGKPLRDAYSEVASRLDEIAGMDPEWAVKARRTGCRWL